VPKRKRRAKTLDNILTGNEVKALLDAFETDRERLAVEGPLYGGFRSSEFIHLTKDWIYGGKIHIPSEIICECWECKKVIYQKVKKKASKKIIKKIRKPSGVWMPKTEKGARGIPLNELSIKLFNWYFKDHHAIRETLPCTRSHYYTIKQIEKRIKDQLIHELFPHVLRGVYASRLAADPTISPFVLCDIMGWTDVKTAMKYIANYRPVPQAKSLNMESFIS